MVLGRVEKKKKVPLSESDGSGKCCLEKEGCEH